MNADMMGPVFAAAAVVTCSYLRCMTRDLADRRQIVVQIVNGISDDQRQQIHDAAGALSAEICAICDITRKVAAAAPGQRGEAGA